VSGESVQVAVKNKTAHSQKWTAPGALAGNEVPNYSDNNGSLDRRMIIFEFPKQVHKSDMTLGTKIDEEIPAILLKCNRAYLNAVRLYAKNNIWNHLPEQFHSSKDDLTESVNSIVSFLRCGQLDFGGDIYMPLENFTSAYETYTNSMGLQRIRFSMDKFSHPLMQVNCRVTKDANTVMRYPRDGSSTFKGKFVIGCDMSRTRHQNVCIDDGLG
jgi:phage/plasmid-associated DNA primase